MSDDEDTWIETERQNAEDYLRRQRIEHLGVGEFPAFHVHPYLALWAVQSKNSPGEIGWWAITGRAVIIERYADDDEIWTDVDKA